MNVGLKKKNVVNVSAGLALKASAVLATVSFVCFFIAIYFAGSIMLNIEIAPRTQVAEWATVFFTAGLVIAFALLIYEIIGKTHARKD